MIEYDDTLRNSVADALAKRTIWTQELRTELKSSAITDMDKVKNNIQLLNHDVDDLINMIFLVWTAQQLLQAISTNHSS